MFDPRLSKITSPMWASLDSDPRGKAHRIQDLGDISTLTSPRGPPRGPRKREKWTNKHRDRMTIPQSTHHITSHGSLSPFRRRSMEKTASTADVAGMARASLTDHGALFAWRSRCRRPGNLMIPRTGGLNLWRSGVTLVCLVRSSGRLGTGATPWLARS